MRADWSANKTLLVLLFWAVCGLALAAGEAAVVVSLSGTVSAQRPDGKVRVLARDSAVHAGEIVMTEQGSAARLKFSDGGLVTLRPGTRLVIESYRFDPDRPQDDAAVLKLLKGGLRTVSGLVGKRGNPDAHQTRTPAATIGIRGTDYALLVCVAGDGGCTAFALPEEFADLAGGLPPGLYLVVFEGSIEATNLAAAQLFSAGRAAYIRDLNSIPRELARDPGLGAAFAILGGPGGGLGGAGGACLVQ